MSKLSEVEFKCPQCQHEGTFHMWESVNSTLNPELREKIFTEELFSYECPECHKTFYIAYGFLYHDMDHKFMLFFDFNHPDDFDYKEEQVTPDLFGMTGSYLFRRVYGLMELKEKILILEHGLNDIAVERLKYMVATQDFPEISKAGYRLYFDSIGPKTEQAPRGTINLFYRNEAEDKTESLSAPMEIYYNFCLACEIDPRMKVSGLQCVDFGFMKRQFGKEE